MWFTAPIWFFFSCRHTFETVWQKKNVCFSFGGYEYSTHISNKITQNTVLSDGLFSTQSCSFEVKIGSLWNPEEIHNRLQWHWDIALKSRFSPQNLAFIYATKSVVCVCGIVFCKFSHGSQYYFCNSKLELEKHEQTVRESICLKYLVNSHNLSKKQNDRKSSFIFL